MIPQARILIAARNDEMAGPLSEGLDQMGWRTVTARGPFAAEAALSDLGVEAVIIDATEGDDDAEALARRLRDLAAPRRIPIVGIGAPGAQAPGDAFDLRLLPPVSPTQVAARLENLLRTTLAEEAFRLRQETFSQLGVRLQDPEANPDPLRILAIGEPNPQFLGLSNSLEALGARVVGAFTSYTAFDFLHASEFDAVVLWGGESSDSASAIAVGMRRNSRLYHIPIFLYLKNPETMTAAEACGRGVSDIAYASTPDADVALRLIEMARNCRRQSTIRSALECARSLPLMDKDTGLFTPEVFNRHIERLRASSAERDRPLSLCALRIRPTEAVEEARRSGWLEKAFPQLGSMVSRLVRIEDCAARLGPDRFGVALPGTPADVAQAVAERIAAVISRTAFDAGQGRAPLVLEFDIDAFEVCHPGQLEQALSRVSELALGDA
ncbi:MAG: diguanylate cyclase domain-containing protein [Phenylobacterium sp.]